MWIIVILLLGACGIIVFHGLNVLYKKTKHYKKQYARILHLMEMSHYERFDVINVGSSQIFFGLDYSRCTLRADNWAIYPQFFEFDYAILQQFSKQINRGAIVFLPICVMEFFGGGDKVGNAADYYPIIDKKYLPYYDKSKYFDARLPLIRHPKWIKYIIRDISWSWEGYPIEQKPCVSPQEYQNDANGYIERWNNGFGTQIPDLSITDEQKRIIQKNIRALGDMARFCRKNGWYPIFLMLPATKYLTEKFTREFIDARVIANIKVADTSTPLLNYWGDARFMGDELYLSSFFMNKAGRRLMTQQVIKDAMRLINKND